MNRPSSTPSGTAVTGRRTKVRDSVRFPRPLRGYRNGTSIIPTPGEGGTDMLKGYKYRLHPTAAQAEFLVETLRTREMMQDCRLSKSIGDAGWGAFVRQLEYKCRSHGRTLIKADPWFASSQVCSACGENGGKKDLQTRECTCAACGVRRASRPRRQREPQPVAPRRPKQPRVGTAR